MCVLIFFFQAEDGIRDLVRSRGLGDVYKRQRFCRTTNSGSSANLLALSALTSPQLGARALKPGDCLLYTSDAADERSSVDLGGRRIIKKKKNRQIRRGYDR